MYAHVVNPTLCNAAIRNTKDAKKRSPDKEEDAMVSKPKAKHCQKLDFHAILILLGEIVLGAPMMECNVVKHLQEVNKVASDGTEISKSNATGQVRIAVIIRTCVTSMQNALILA